MILTIYTLIHVIISLVGILAGLVILYGLLAAKRLDGWTATFLIATVLTSMTGFFFPRHHVMPSHIVGLISLVVLAVAIYARYPKRMSGHWRTTYVITAILAFYLNFFVLIVQSFLKIPALHALAPTQTEPPFKIVQLVVLILFVALGIIAVIRFKKVPAA